MSNPRILIGKQLPDDPRLYLCLVKWHEKKYSTHLYNKEGSGLYSGNYFEFIPHAMVPTIFFADVMRDFANRCITRDIRIDADTICNQEVVES